MAPANSRQGLHVLQPARTQDVYTARLRLAVDMHGPDTLAPVQVGVYVGCCGSELHAQWLSDIQGITGYEQTGCTLSMFANRLSFTFDFRGPSKAVDTGAQHVGMHAALLLIPTDEQIKWSAAQLCFVVLVPGLVCFRRVEQLHLDRRQSNLQSLYIASCNLLAREAGQCLVHVAPALPSAASLTAHKLTGQAHCSAWHCSV